jgi:prepilin-type N-terminal cleavage/methylation domain-containing protein
MRIETNRKDARHEARSATSWRAPWRPRASRLVLRAFTLIEMIGVLAIIAIVAAIITPSLARRISRTNGEKEDQVLSMLADGLIRAVRASQSIPGANSWATNISTQTGLPVNEVLYVNPAITANGRVYLIHPSFVPTNAAGTDPLWAQTSNGATSVTNAKIMILSVHKAGLALPMTSGRAASVATFDALWNWHFDPATKAPPPGWPAGWTGNGEYLHVQRVNLLAEFNRITFSNAHYPSLYPSAQFGSAASITLNTAAAIDAWYLDGTYVRLYKDSGAGGALDLSHSIVTAMNFLYESNRWRIP